MSQEKICIAIHGCHVEAKDWERIIWGDPKNGVYGRAAAAIKLAHECDADMISFSTGASERGGKKEAVLIYEHAFMHLGDLFLDNSDISKLEEWLSLVKEIDCESQNTADEMRYLSENCKERRITTLDLVSSPWHIPRCFANALAHQSRGGFEGVDIFAHASAPDIYGADDIVILEPPHRGDDEMLKAADHELPHKVVPRIFSLKPKERTRAMVELNKIINRLARKM